MGTEQQLEWQSAGTNLAEVRERLAQLWHNFPAAKVRESVQNLVVFAADSGWGEECGASLRGVSGLHPSRSVVLLPGGESLSARVELRVRPLRGGGPGIFGEEIVLAVPPVQRSHPASLVWPLLLPDLPTVVFWGGDPEPEAVAFRELLEMADLLAVDSATFVRPRESWAWLGEAWRDRHLRVWGDLNWPRLGAWREAVARLFDDPEARRLRPWLREIEVEPGLGGPGGSWLLAAWMAVRLGGRPVVRGEAVAEIKLGLGPTIRFPEGAVGIRFGAAGPAEFTVRVESGRFILSWDLPGREIQRWEGSLGGAALAAAPPGREGMREIAEILEFFSRVPRA